MKSGNQHQFAVAPSVQIARSRFRRDHLHTTTLNAGYLVPIYRDEVLPGDTKTLNSTLYGRLATPIKPFMTPLYLDTFYFFVPNRLIWDHWQEFCGEKKSPSDTTEYLVPHMVSPNLIDHEQDGYPRHSVADYLGIPTGVPGLEHTALYHRAYMLIWNEWFRDENLQEPANLHTNDGPDYWEDPNNLLRRGKRHDYFTSALPWPQKGPAIELPLGLSAPVMANHSTTTVFNTIQDNLSTQQKGQIMYNSGDNDARINKLGNATADFETGLYADLSGASAATINQLRQAFQLQKMAEKDARGGTRYVELLKSHFGVTSDDYRMMRPVYLGGGSTMINVSPVTKTGSTDATSPQGNLSAIATVHSARNGFSQSFTEHGVILGLASVRADLIYQQGLPRMFSRLTKYDYYWPSLAQIGEQEIKNKELFAQGPDVIDTVTGAIVDDMVFGYQERYAEYRYSPSYITGAMRSTDAQSLDVWHLGQDFANLPTLSDEWIQDNPPIDRVVAVTTEPHFILDCYHRQSDARPMPVFGVPGNIDHF